MSVRTLARVVTVFWFLSWFALYLEVVRYQHLVLSRLGDVISPPTSEPVGPGGFVRTVVICSVVTPAASALAYGWYRGQTAIRRANNSNDSLPWWTAMLAVFGVGVALLGAVNQVIRKPPMIVDVTLRTGNGGFVVFGVSLALAAVMWRKRLGAPDGVTTGRRRGTQLSGE
jgi:hypothetical protein